MIFTIFWSYSLVISRITVVSCYEKQKKIQKLYLYELSILIGEYIRSSATESK